MRILLVFILSLISINAMGQDAKAQGILDKLSTKMKGMKSFYIEFNASIKNSTNGTFVNDHKLVAGSEMVLASGDRVKFGATTYLFRGPESA